MERSRTATFRSPDIQVPGAAQVCSDADAKLLQIKWRAFPPEVFDRPCPIRLEVASVASIRSV